MPAPNKSGSLSLSGAFAMLALCASILACVGPEGNGVPPGEVAPWDVRGNYALEYDNKLTITLNVGGVERRATANGPDEIVDLGTYMGEPLKLDLGEYCGREEVVCPSEALWDKVSISQQDVDKRFDAHIINVIDNTDRDLPPGQRAGVVGGFVNHKDLDRFTLGIDGQSASEGDCGALAISLAAGRFQREGERTEEVTYYKDAEGKECDPQAMTEGCEEHTRDQLIIPPDGAITGITDGKVGIGWLGACAFGPVVAGATLTIETGFVGTRTGDFDPPEFTPIEMPDVPDQDVFVDEDMSEDADASSDSEDLDGMDMGMMEGGD
jgi:hypothetical protein